MFRQPSPNWGKREPSFSRCRPREIEARERGGDVNKKKACLFHATAEEACRQNL